MNRPRVPRRDVADIDHAPSGAYSVVAQVRVLPDRISEFEACLPRIQGAARAAPGHISSEQVPPSPPLQEDWVLIHRFGSLEHARAWLTSEQRQWLLGEVRPLLIGDVDVQLFSSTGPQESHASAIITTTVAPEEEDAFLEWQARIAAAQASFDGFDGYRLQHPIPGVQPDWVAILRYDTEEHMRAWLESSERRTLIEENGSFGAQARVRVVRSGFDAWFDAPHDSASSRAPTWKQSMLVLLVLYPVVFLFGLWVQDPVLLENGLPFWLALFIGNVVSVAALGWLLVPAANRLFGWWLYPVGSDPRRTSLVGAALVIGLYVVTMAVFAWSAV